MADPKKLTPDQAAQVRRAVADAAAAGLDPREVAEQLIDAFRTIDAATEQLPGLPSING